MRKIQLIMIMATLVPNIVLAQTDLFEQKPKYMPEMIKPDVEVTPYNKRLPKDLDVIKPDQRTGPAPVRIPDVVSEGIICTDSVISLRVLFDGPVSKNYSGLVAYSCPGCSTLPYPPRPWQEGADSLSWSPSRDGKALHATLDQKLMNYFKRGVAEDYNGSLHYSINMDGKMIDRFLSLKGMLLPSC